MLEFDFYKPLCISYKKMETELNDLREQNEFLKEYANFLKDKVKVEDSNFYSSPN